MSVNLNVVCFPLRWRVSRAVTVPRRRTVSRRFQTARLTSNVVSSFCVRELSESWPKPGRNPFETWTIFIRRLAHRLDGERAALAKQALPLKGTRGSVLRVKLRQVLRWFANAGASDVASFGDHIEQVSVLTI